MPYPVAPTLRIIVLLCLMLNVVLGFVHIVTHHGPLDKLYGEAPRRVEVCQNKHCKKRGAAKTFQLFEELATDTEVLKADMSHTDHGCFDECTMGPNVRIDGEPRTDGGKVLNGIKSRDDVARILGLTP